MKPARWLFALSLTANVALLAYYFNQHAATHELEVTARQNVMSAAAEAKAAALAAKVVPLWTRIHSTDLDALQNRLKEMGFSGPEIRAIMSDQIAAKYSSRSLHDGAPTPYWKTNMMDYTDPKVRQEQDAHMVEEQEAWRKYDNFAEELADNPAELEAARRRYGNLSVEKLEAIGKIETDYQLLSLKQQRSNSNDGESYRKTYDLLEKEKAADIAKALTPDEYAEYELRNSSRALSLRSQLDLFKPSEEEYKAIFAIKKTFDGSNADPALAPADRKKLRDQYNAQVAAALTPDRAADYFAVTQNGGDKTSRLLDRLDLPPRTYTEIKAVQTDVTQRADAIRADATLPAPARDAQLAALAQTARTQLTAKLGPNGFEAYNDMKGDWIRALQPK